MTLTGSHGVLARTATTAKPLFLAATLLRECVTIEALLVSGHWNLCSVVAELLYSRAVRICSLHFSLLVGCHLSSPSSSLIPSVPANPKVKYQSRPKEGFGLGLTA